ncbi:MAG: hypothetical protein OXG72_16605, partial [Acidobacteria bacterium]|nr:hypothetical protein [Acidobacteriota bacterium]
TAENRAKYESLSQSYRDMWYDGDFATLADYARASEELVIEFFGSPENFQRDCQDRRMAHYEKAARSRERAERRMGL